MNEYTSTYCYYASQQDESDVNRHYHDHHYGYPVKSDVELFERLVLEINQAGLSWTTILKKQKAFLSAYDQFDIDTVANYQEDQIQRLLQDKGIIRNRLKIEAAIYNAKAIQKIQREFGSFAHWLAIQPPQELPLWVKLMKQHFRFVGGEIVHEFLMSIGILGGAHHPNCPIYSLLQSKSRII